MVVEEEVEDMVEEEEEEVVAVAIFRTKGIGLAGFLDQISRAITQILSTVGADSVTSL